MCILDIDCWQSIVPRTKRDILSSYNDVKVPKTFESDIFSGAKLETDADNIDTLLALPEVVAAWPNRKVHLVAPINARQVAANQSEEDTYAVHWATGVESLHEQGMLGEGAKVGIIDTGVWYTHEALGVGAGDGTYYRSNAESI